MARTLLRDHRGRSALRTVTLLVGLYLAVSVLTLVAVVLMRDDPAVVNAAVWIRSTIVVATAVLMAVFLGGTARGDSRMFLRLRLVSAIMVVAIVVIIALPGTFPVWLKLEQALCGVLLLGVVVLVNGRRMRSAYA